MRAAASLKVRLSNFDAKLTVQEAKQENFLFRF